MDLMTISGLIIGVAAVWFVLSAGGILKLLFNLQAAILVFGGVIGATLITYPWSLIKKIPKCTWFMFFPRRFLSQRRIVAIFENCSKKVHRSGIDQTLLEEVPPGNIFFRRAMSLLVDGFEADFIKETLKKEIDYLKKRHRQVYEVFRSMGAYAPIFGLLGTLIGVVQVLRNLTDPVSMGASMAIAITTTFYGIFSTNFIFLPIAGKLEALTEKEVLADSLIIEGVLSLKNGEIPSVIKKKLESFVGANERK
ncbi:MAG: MotA/TolQ/ExbB proton channel family protein [Elusimicrobia bacterium]|nr:MotA/TolQ/ExbB proton channel family protein [Elusimicrobiota bacterium]